MKVPFCRPALDEDDVDAVVKVLRSGNLYHSEVCQKVEHALHMEFRQYPVLVNSCTAALILACEEVVRMAADRYASIVPTIVVPDMTFCSTAHAVMHAGARLVLCDVDEKTGLLDLECLGKILDENEYVAGVIVVDLYGQLPNWDEARKLIDTRAKHPETVYIIEDAAHSYGSMDIRGDKIGEHADFTCVSFYATKVVTCADGGVVLCKNEDTAERLKRRANCGITSRASERYTKGFQQYDVAEVGHKMMMNDLNAALLFNRLAWKQNKVKNEAEARISLAEFYNSYLGGAQTQMSPLQRTAQTFDNMHLTVWKCPTKRYRDGLIDWCQKHEIQLSVHFRALSTTTAYKDAQGAGNCAKSLLLADTIVSLPNYPGLACYDIERVCTVISSFDKAYA